MSFNKKNYFICILFTSLVILVGYLDPFFVETARLKSFDYYQRNTVPVTAENVAIVEIDENSLDKHGQWPWPRDLIADSVIKAYENGAALVVLPILFSEPDRMGHDDYFNEIISQAPVVLGQSASTKGKGKPVPRGIVVIGEDLTPFTFEYKEAIGPIEQLGNSAAGVGMMTTTPELDGVVRRMPLIVQTGGSYYPTLSLEVLRLFGGKDSYQVKADVLGIESVRIYGLEPVITDPNSRIWLNYKYDFPTVSFIEEDWSHTVQDKIVILSPTAEGLTNTVATSVGVKYAHEVHATNLQMIIDEERLERKEEFKLHELVFTAGICSFIIVIALWFPYWASLITIASTFTLPLLGHYLYQSNSLYDFTWPMITIFITWSVASFIRFVQENKTKKLIKNQFEHYLAPSVVKLLQKNPNQLQLGGNTKELTILFSDLRDFTSLSEKFKSNPQELTDLINKYLTPMTGCVIDNGGTVDKFIGDALMAFWNAPIVDNDHRYHSIKCALEMFNLLEQLNKELASKNIELKMGVGVNTGDVVVGNMGSNQRFDYTCLGDAVNLAARLESQTKSYRVGLLVGEKTRQQLTDKFVFCELDMIAVKGKTEGIRIYTVLSSNKSLPNHEAFLQAYRDKKWNTAIKHANFCKRAIPELTNYYDMMIERIELLKKNQPGENWDTIFRATSK